VQLLARWKYQIGALSAFALLSAVGLFQAGNVEARNDPAQQTATGADTTQQPVQAVQVRDFSYTPMQLSTIAGQPLTINVTNAGPTAHTFTISGVTDSGSIPSGQSRSVQLTPGQAGTLTFYCTIHGQASMSGTLSVMTPATNPVQPQQTAPQQPAQPPPAQQPQQVAPQQPPRQVMQPPSTGDAGLLGLRND
jgi:plastocyanin